MQQPTIGEKIFQYRSEKGMTQKELADQCNIDIRTIQRIESGEVIPRMYTIKLLAAALGIEPATILKTGNGRSGDLPALAIKMSLNAGIIFSVNAFLVVYYLIEPGLTPFIQIPSLIVHAVTGVILFKGFYLLGKHSQNRILEIPSLLFMVLFPIVNVLFLLRIYFPRQEDFSSISFASNIFTILCLNDILIGIGLVIQSNKAGGPKKVNLFKLAGILLIIPSILYLASNAIIVLSVCLFLFLPISS